MSEREKQIIETFIKLIPVLSDMEREKLLSFGEGMAFIKDKKNAIATETNKQNVS